MAQPRQPPALPLKTQPTQQITSALRNTRPSKTWKPLSQTQKHGMRLCPNGPVFSTPPLIFTRRILANSLPSSHAKPVNPYSIVWLNYAKPLISCAFTQPKPPTRRQLASPCVSRRGTFRWQSILVKWGRPLRLATLSLLNLLNKPA